MTRPRVLFICVQNSARSQIAEAWAHKFCAGALEAQSAGLEPGTVNPLAVEVMREVGIDIGDKSTQSVFELFRAGKTYSYVVTVCDEASAERCPIFPKITKRYHWSFADPAAFEGSWEDKLSQARIVRDAIKSKVEEWCADVCPVAV